MIWSSVPTISKTPSSNALPFTRTDQAVGRVLHRVGKSGDANAPSASASPAPAAWKASATKFSPRLAITAVTDHGRQTHPHPEDAKRIAAAARAEAQRNGWRVVIAVVDDGGHLLYLDAAMTPSLAAWKPRYARHTRDSVPGPTKAPKMRNGADGYTSGAARRDSSRSGLPLTLAKLSWAVGISGVRSFQDGSRGGRCGALVGA